MKPIRSTYRYRDDILHTIPKYNGIWFYFIQFASADSAHMCQIQNKICCFKKVIFFLDWQKTENGETKDFVEEGKEISEEKR